MKNTHETLRRGPIKTRRGGWRKGAGRKPKGDRAGIPHVRRESFPRGSPIHVTLRVHEGVPNLRSPRATKVLTEALEAASENFEVRLVRYSLGSNHIHLILEAVDERALSRAMKGLCVRIARKLNRAFGRKGAVFSDRFHAHVLRTPREAQNAVRFVPSSNDLAAEPRSYLLRKAWGLPWLRSSNVPPQPQLRIGEPIGHRSHWTRHFRAPQPLAVGPLG